MNKIDLLKKLIQLANHNPNEHEANRAARKVCKLLEELKVNFSSRPKEKPFKPVTYNDVVRSTTPAWRSTPQEPPVESNFGDIFEEIFRRRNRQRTRPIDEETVYSTPFREGAWTRPWIYDPFTGKSKQEPKPKRKLKCKHCGTEVETGFVGLPEMYECNDCLWRDYEKKKKEKKT